MTFLALDLLQIIGGVFVALVGLGSLFFMLIQNSRIDDRIRAEARKKGYQVQETIWPSSTFPGEASLYVIRYLDASGALYETSCIHSSHGLVWGESRLQRPAPKPHMPSAASEVPSAVPPSPNPPAPPSMEIGRSVDKPASELAEELARLRAEVGALRSEIASLRNPTRD